MGERSVPITSQLGYASAKSLHEWSVHCSDIIGGWQARTSPRDRSQCRYPPLSNWSVKNDIV